MIKNKLFSLLVLAIGCSRCFVSQAADVVTLHRALAWKAIEISVTETEKVKSLYFEGAAYNDANLPVFYESISLSGNPQSFTASIENAQYETLAETALVNV